MKEIETELPYTIYVKHIKDNWSLIQITICSESYLPNEFLKELGELIKKHQK